MTQFIRGVGGALVGIAIGRLLATTVGVGPTTITEVAAAGFLGVIGAILCTDGRSVE